MSKRIYRSVSVKDVSAEGLRAKVRPDCPIVVGIDVAKVENKAAVMQGGVLLRTVGWKAPKETSALIALVRELKAMAPVEVVLESTGTYGDAVRAQLASIEVPVFRVSTKHAHDSAELFDGVPSSHDAKASQLLVWLHLQKRSRPWSILSDRERDLAAATQEYARHGEALTRNIGYLEAIVARHFPELTTVLSLRSATALELIQQYGSATEIAAHAAAAAELMRSIGGPLLLEEKVQAVIEAARASTGMPMTQGERRTLMHLATEALRQRALKADAKKHLELLAEAFPAVVRMAVAIGVTTATIVFVEAHDPASYKCSGAYVKALGLNLKERSSGNRQGQLAITKRGPATARRYLFLAVQRLIQRDPCFKAWYVRKVERDSGKHKLKAIVALMRKLARALYHVARGADFDASKLFDLGRLGLNP